MLEELLAAIKPLKAFKPLKPAEGYGSYEFDDIDELIENFVKPAFEDGETIIVQPKWDGIRMVAHKKGDKVALFTEDRARDRSEILPDLVEAIKSLPADSVILDGECLLGEIDEKGQFIPRPRPDAMKIVAGKEVVTEPYRYFLFDIWYLDGEDLTDKPYSERLATLSDFLSKAQTNILVLTPSRWLEPKASEQEVKEAVVWAAKELGSEGAMLKYASSTYRASGRTPEWAKYKEWKAIKAIIIGISKVFPPGTTEENFKEAFRESQTYVFRAAIQGPNGILIPMRAKKRVTESDLILRRVTAGEEDPVTGRIASKDEWRGRDDPRIWKMMEGFPHPEPGDWAYATTYAIKLEEEPDLGDIVEVAAIGYQYFIDEDTGEIHFSWMHPRVKGVHTDDDEPTSWEKFVELLNASGYKLPEYEVVDGKLIVKQTQVEDENAVGDATGVTDAGSRECKHDGGVVIVHQVSSESAEASEDEIESGEFAAGDEDLPETLSYMYPRFFKAFGVGLPRIVVHACVALMPGDYDTYVELFAGVGGGLLRAKKRQPGETEILVDIDPFVVAFLKVVKSGDWRKLRRFKWSPDKQRWLEICEAARNGEFDDADTLKKAYLFAYTTFYSRSNYGFHGSYSPYRRYEWRKELDYFFARCALWEERLKGVRIYCMDAFDAIPKFDSSKTFFFADPPWITPSVWTGEKPFYSFGWTIEDHERFMEACKDIKGRIMILNQAFAKKFKRLGPNWTYRTLSYIGKISPWITAPENVEKTEHAHNSYRKVLYIIANYELPEIPASVKRLANRVSAKEWTEKGVLEDEELTHEEQRELEEARFGDPYLVIHDTKNYEDGYRFVYMRHYRGLWGEDERKAIKQLLKQWENASGSEKEDIWKQLVKEYGVYRLTVSFETLAKRAQKASDERADVSKVIRECITQEMPKRMSAEEVAEDIINLASVHGDLRIENPASPKTQLIGWTLATPAVAVQFLDGTILPVLRDKFVENEEGDRIVAVRKARQPHVWLTVVTEKEPYLWVPPSGTGSTKNTWALFEWKANGVAWFGMQRRDYHEMWLLFEETDDDVETPSGKWVARLLPGKGPKVGGEGEYWQFWYPEEDGQLPYVLTHTPEQAKKEWKGRRYDVIILNLDVVPIVLDVFDHIRERFESSEKYQKRLETLSDWEKLEKLPER